MSYKDFFKNWPIIGSKLKTPRVSVLRLSGVIAESGGRRENINLARFKDPIDKAFDVYNVSAVCLVINCPGGSPAQTALLSNYIKQKSKEKKIPIFAFVEDVAASGGYWLACAAEEIYTQDVSIVGSIGVISASFGFDKLIAEYNISRRVHTSGKDKSFMDPFMPETAKDKTRLSDIQKDMHTHFIEWVKSRRGEKLKGTKSKLFEGGFWTAKTALELGLIDGVDDVYSFSKVKFGENVKFIDVTPEKGFVKSLFGVKSSIVQDVLAQIEEKEIWTRYGL